MVYSFLGNFLQESASLDPKTPVYPLVGYHFSLIQMTSDRLDQVLGNMTFPMTFCQMLSIHIFFHSQQVWNGQATPNTPS